MKKQEIREKVKEMYEEGKNVEEIATSLEIGKRQVIGILVYLNIYNKPTNEREKIVKSLSKKLSCDARVFMRIPTKFLDFLDSKI